MPQIRSGSEVGDITLQQLMLIGLTGAASRSGAGTGRWTFHPRQTWLQKAPALRKLRAGYRVM